MYLVDYILMCKSRSVCSLQTGMASLGLSIVDHRPIGLCVFSRLHTDVASSRPQIARSVRGKLKTCVASLGLSVLN